MNFGTGRSKHEDPVKYFNAFVHLIPEYCKDEDGRLAGNPDQWWSHVISYSLYLGLAVGMFDEHLAKKIKGGMTPGITETSDLVLRDLMG